MTGERIVELQQSLDRAKSLNGDIALLKERLQWLADGEPLEVTFPKRPSKPVAELPPNVAEELRESYRVYLGDQLTDKLEAFESLQIPSPSSKTGLRNSADLD